MTQDTKDVSGVQALHGALVSHAADVDKRISRLMVSAAGRIVKNESKRLALSHGFKRTGALLANIAIKREPKAPAGTTQYNLGVRHGRDLGRKAAKTLAVGASGRVVVKYANDPWYWMILEVGAKPHIIKPKNGKGLAWTRIPEASKVRRIVNHPGFAGKPFIGPALENKRAEAIGAMEARLKKELDKRNA